MSTVQRFSPAARFGDLAAMADDLAALRAQILLQGRLLAEALARIEEQAEILREMEGRFPAPLPRPAETETVVDINIKSARATGGGPTMADLAAGVAARTGVALADLRGRDKHLTVVMARALFCVLAHRAGFSSTRIGRYLGGRDHSTILHAMRQEARALAYFGDREGEA